jgi:hypothetical protein
VHGSLEPCSSKLLPDPAAGSVDKQVQRLIPVFSPVVLFRVDCCQGHGSGPSDTGGKERYCRETQMKLLALSKSNAILTLIAAPSLDAFRIPEK